MTRNRRIGGRGFVLIEALVAVLIVALGVLALARLESMVVGAAGEAKARSTAMALARSKVDELRGSALRTQYVSALVSQNPATVTLGGIAYSVEWTITKPNGALDNHLVQVVVSWTDRAGNTQKVDLNSFVAWNDPALGQATTQDLGKNVIAPTGAARRGPGTFTPGNPSPTTVSTGADNITKLSNASGTILSLAPVNGSPQYFSTINGRVVFDESAGNGLPPSGKVFLRLSSEGECIYDNRSASLQVLPAGATGNAVKYRYFDYICYVGPGWYGNVGVTIIDDNSNPTICVGDPGFTDATYTNTVSPRAVTSTTRSYRGFYRQTSGQTVSFISTGMPSNGTYGKVLAQAVRGQGKPTPSLFPSFYPTSTYPPDGSSDFFNQDFLVSKVTGNNTCAGKMSQIAGAGTFSPNAGKYFCISPDDRQDDADECPATWPGFPSSACAVTVSGSFNYTDATANQTASVAVTCSVSDLSSCTCSSANTSGAANYECSTTGGSAQLITVQAVSTLSTWTNATAQACIPSSSCVAPANTASVQYQCAPTASCQTAGEVGVQSRTVTLGPWVAVQTYQNAKKCADAKPADTTTTRYQCTSAHVLESSTLVLGNWGDTSPTCLSTLSPIPADTATSRYTWDASGCAAGSWKLMKQIPSGTSTTQTCTRTSTPLNCAPLNFNIDSGVATCTTVAG